MIFKIIIVYIQIWLIVLIGLQGINIYQIEKDIKVLERYKMYDREIDFGNMTQGVYHNDRYYCVWTEGRTFENINRTDVHEQCHALIAKDDKDHFCG